MITDADRETLDQLHEWISAYAARAMLVRRVLWTGSRTWSRPFLPRAILAALPATAVLVHGDATGADKLGSMLWTHCGGSCEAHALPEGWWRSGRAMPLARDRAMVEAGADLCVALIRQGTTVVASYTADYAERRGIKVFRFRQDW